MLGTDVYLNSSTSHPYFSLTLSLSFQNEIVAPRANYKSHEERTFATCFKQSPFLLAIFIHIT